MLKCLLDELRFGDLDRDLDSDTDFARLFDRRFLSGDRCSEFFLFSRSSVSLSFSAIIAIAAIAVAISGVTFGFFSLFGVRTRGGGGMITGMISSSSSSSPSSSLTGAAAMISAEWDCGVIIVRAIARRCAVFIIGGVAGCCRYLGTAAAAPILW